MTSGVSHCGSGISLCFGSVGRTLHTAEETGLNRVGDKSTESQPLPGTALTTPNCALWAPTAPWPGRFLCPQSGNSPRAREATALLALKSLEATTGNCA